MRDVRHMWRHVFEYTLPAIIGAGAVGLVFGLTRQRPAAWIVLMVLMIALIAASTQIVWEIFPQWHDGWKHSVVVIGVALAVAVPFSFLMKRFRKKDGHDA
jgi:uncharacterized membrane protein AbrB (regulator of aidB expression)